MDGSANLESELGGLDARLVGFLHTGRPPTALYLLVAVLAECKRSYRFPCASPRARPFPQAAVLRAIATAVARVASTLSTASTGETGTSNLLGDKQLVADVAADRYGTCWPGRAS